MNFKVYYDEESVKEGTKIIYHYYRRIKKNKKNNIHPSYRYFDWSYIILLFFIISISIGIFYIFKSGKAGPFIIAYTFFIYTFIWYIFIKKIVKQTKTINKLKEEIMQSTNMLINETEIRVNREKEPCFILWTDIKEIALNPNCILVIPKRNNDRPILIPIDYKKELLGMINRLGYKELVRNYITNK